MDSFYVDQVNVCVDEIEGCLVAAPDLEQDLVDITYSCITCKDDHFPVVSLDKNRILSREAENVEDSPKFSPLSYAPSKTC
ncbi:MAG: hypothetical protein DHS20C09_15620 [marine bacterium B5-7]|nr:MAG: hypothetical protein DHS20C09_15620 [marine bacterium B5-7]